MPTRLITLSLFALLAGSLSAALEGTRPNIILVITDDQIDTVMDVFASTVQRLMA